MGADERERPAKPTATDPPRRTRHPSWRVLRWALMAVVAGAIVYALVLVMSVRGALHERNDELSADARAALDEPSGSARTASRTILVMGTDTSRARRAERGGSYGGADSMLVVRIDPTESTIDMLSLPRDLVFDRPTPDSRSLRIGDLFAQGGAGLAIRTVREELGIDINHVAVVDLDGFRDLVDAVGGITVDNPYPVRSQVDFDGRSWAFPPGRLRLDGRRARAYARIRQVDQASVAQNPDEAEELGRAFRQQRVLEATLRRVTLARLLGDPLRFPRAVLTPITTDLRLADAAGWAAAGVDGSWGGLRCRIGGTYVLRDGTQVLEAGPALREAVDMFERGTAPIPPQHPTDGGCQEAEAVRR